MILDFLAPHPPKKLGGVQNFLLKMKKIKVVQNCLQWRENWPFYPPPPKKINIGYLKKIVKNEKIKIGQEQFLNCLAPDSTKKNWVSKKKCCQI